MLSAGDRLGPYEVVGPLGAGGMGEVYRARDTKLDREVALKVLPQGSLADETTRRRFRKEALVLSRLSHPHIASLFDLDATDEGTDFLVMELVPGLALDVKLKRGPLPEVEVVRLGAQLARALAAAHAQGVVHRDLKPANLKLTADGLLKVLDFGLARIAPVPAGEGTTDTASGIAAGTPPYMSPEQLLGKEVDERSDVYAAGVVLYEMAVGRRPFGEASGAQLVARILGEPLPSPRQANPALSPLLEQVILKATDKDPGLRHQTAKDLLVDLERLAGGATLGSSKPGARGPAEATARPRRASQRLAVAGLVIAVLVAIGAWLAPHGEPRIAATRLLGRGNVTGLETDGANVYYTEAPDFYDGVADRLMAVPLAGGPSRQIPVPWRRGVMLRGIRRDPPALLLRVGALAEARLWIFPLGQGSPSPLQLEDAAPIHVAWSPRGDRLALAGGADGVQALGILGTAGGGNRMLSRMPPVAGAGTVTSLKWHPSGERLRLLTSAGTRWQDVDVRDGSSAETSFEAPADTWGDGAWTPDGSFYLQGSRRGVVAHREPALLPFGKRRVSSGGSAYTEMLRPTPDGRQIVAFVFRPGAEVLRLGAGGPPTRPALGGARAWHLAYSPDGSRVAWASAEEWPARLWVSMPGRNVPQALGDAHVVEGAPMAWSPDGRRIAFAAIEDRARPLAIYRELPHGSESRAVLRLASPDEATVEALAPDPETTDQGDPCWSPDGSWLAYGTSPSVPAPALYLRRVDLTTREVTRLPGSDGLWSPRCAADGRILAIDWAAQVQHGLGAGSPARQAFFKVRDPESGRWTPLVVPVGGVVSEWGLWSPNWTPDGRHVYAGYKNLVLEFDARSGRVRESVDLGDLGPTLGWIGLDPSGTLLVARDASQREIVVMDLE